MMINVDHVCTNYPPIPPTFSQYMNKLFDIIERQQGLIDGIITNAQNSVEIQKLLYDRIKNLEKAVAVQKKYTRS